MHAIGLEGNVSGLTITHNAISALSVTSGNPIAVWFESEDTSFASSHVNNNNLTVGSSGIGIAVDPALSGGPVDGTNNW